MGEDEEILRFGNVRELLDSYAREFSELYKGKIESDGRMASGNLIGSVKTYVKYNDDNYEVWFDANEYYKYIEQGARWKDKRPPIAPILEWVKAKRIMPQPRNGKLPTQKQLAYAIRESIYKHGIIKDKGYDGGYYVAHTIKELNEHYMPLLEEALSRDFEEWAISYGYLIESVLAKAF